MNDVPTFTEDAEDVPRFLMPGDEPPELLTHFKPLEDELKMEGHTDNVAAVAWESPTTVWSGSYDHTLKSWDSTTGQLTQSFEVPKAVMALACVAGGGRVAWCGGGDKAVHMWDPRVGATTGATTSLISHTVRESLTSRARFFWLFWLFLVLGGPGVGDETTPVSRVGDDVGDTTITLIFS